MIELIAVCVTAIVCSIILAGGINRAAFYFSAAVATMWKEIHEDSTRLLKYLDQKDKQHD